jgi:predicted  nucleic acid-binding Zn-ribbon protein
MQLELGSIISAAVAILGAFTTSLLYATGARTDAKEAHKRIDYLNEQIIDLRSRHDALDSKIVEKLSAIEKSLARIQGRLSIEEHAD